MECIDHEPLVGWIHGQTFEQLLIVHELRTRSAETLNDEIEFVERSLHAIVVDRDAQIFAAARLARLQPQEIEAVLAHELGHFKLKHIVKRIVMMFALSLGFLALLGYLKTQPWFYDGLGVNPVLLPGQSNDAMVLLLFQLLGVLAGLAFREVDRVQKDTARSPFW